MINNKGFRALRALSSLRKKKTWGPFVEAFETTGFDHGFSISWSQAAEDLALLAVLAGVDKGRYLDIGAHHPTRFSVTRHLFQHGWRGVNVDANADLLPAFLETRPEDVSLNYCVGEQEKYQLSVFNETAISTVNPSWDAKFVRENNIRDVVRTVPGIRLKELLDRYFPEKGPDLLNIDIEGADYEALKSGDLDSLPFERRPSWVLVESNAPLSNVLKTETVQLLMSYGYEIWLVLPFASLLRITPH
ncbi:fkbM_fam, methyltransferase, FkbM family [Candidatus Nanopelagicaceae bacterium]